MNSVAKNRILILAILLIGIASLFQNCSGITVGNPVADGSSTQPPMPVKKSTWGFSGFDTSASAEPSLELCVTHITAIYEVDGQTKTVDIPLNGDATLYDLQQMGTVIDVEYFQDGELQSTIIELADECNTGKSFDLLNGYGNFAIAVDQSIELPAETIELSPEEILNEIDIRALMEELSLVTNSAELACALDPTLCSTL